MYSVDIMVNGENAWYNKADEQFMLGNYDKQQEYLEKSISSNIETLRTNPNNKFALYYLGRSYFDKAMIQDALSCYDKLVQYDNNCENAWYSKGICHIISPLPNIKTAIECFEKAMDINPNYYRAYYGLATAFFQINNFQNAIKYYLDGVNVAKNSKNVNMRFIAETYSSIALCYERLNDKGNAIKYYDLAIESAESCGYFTLQNAATTNKFIVMGF